jgi:cytosine/uracil/thiamine/allantoin permease
VTIPLLIGSAIFALSVVIQVLAILGLLNFLRRRDDRLGKSDVNLQAATATLSGSMLILFVGHLFQVGLWAALFVRLDQFERYATAFYHSMVNFSSLGYGDVVMSADWRLLGAMEATSGILMFGISTGVGLAVFNRLSKQLDRIEGEIRKDPSP